ncbi:serine/threonine protein kinase [Arthroderma uncinatum]|uniref:serine/threonine protein kinase n=1 Tax=Arthroderma uncinatum TaxID=74035 RepID=UPI00144A9835|nr:serine/threonine protein kinase [Arthroderma uncinatum]KAF3484174.1 serine/threonine protein kinase [Arthroderma uncinatum]
MEDLENEIQVFKRLGCHKGIIHCYKTSQYGIELARAQEDLESYLGNSPEPEDSLKVNWMSSVVDTLSHVHSRKVFVDDIALRNILILDGQVQLADFGQSVLLPLDTDVASADDKGLNVQVEILHLGWVLYSIASWKVYKYYFFDDGLGWPELDSFPHTDDVLCGGIIAKCWRGEYTSVDHVKEEVHSLLASQGKLSKR